MCQMKKIKIIKDHYGVIREIYGEFHEIRNDQDKMRDEFHALIEAEGKYYLRTVGTISPNQLGKWYVEISPEKAKFLERVQSSDLFSSWAGYYGIVELDINFQQKISNFKIFPLPMMP